MQILHVVPSYMPAYRYGGPIYSVHGLCKALAARDNDVHVFTTNIDGPNDSDVPIGTPVNINEVKIWYFPSKNLRRLYWSPPMAKELTRQIGKFDVVHLQSIFLWPTWVAARTAKRFNVPYILAPRGMLIKDVINRKSKIVKKAWIRLFEQKNLQKASGIHVTTKAEELECKRFGYNLPPFYVIPNGIEPYPIDKPLKAISEPIKRLMEKQPMLLFLGRINWKKGLDRLIPALANVRDANLVIAGNDEESYTPFLKTLAKDYHVLDRITFLGFVDGDDKNALLRAATALVLPSYSENFGNVVLEAMAAQCPVVVSPEVGLADIVEQSGSGIVSDSTPSILASEINRILDNGPLRYEMGQSGKRTVAEQFTWSSVAARMESVYKEITKKY